MSTVLIFAASFVVGWLAAKLRSRHQQWRETREVLGRVVPERETEVYLEPKGGRLR